MDEVSALRALAVPGSSREAVSILALDLLSPWSSTRHGVRDRPDRGTDSFQTLRAFLRDVEHMHYRAIINLPAGQSRLVRRVIPPPASAPRFHMPMTARRAPRGSAKNCIGIYADIDPQLHAAYERAVAERNITKRQLIEAALRRELADPTTTAAQGGLYDVA